MPLAHAEVSRFLWSDPAMGRGSSIESAAHHNGTTVAVGQYGMVRVSTDGITWRHLATDTSQTLYGVAYGNNRWVVVGKGGVVLTSENASEWDLQEFGNTYFTGLTHDGSDFLATASGGGIYRSADGLSWTEEANPASVNLRAIASSDTMSIAVGDYGMLLRRGQDGSWAHVGAGVTNQALYCVAWTGTDFVAAGALGTVVESADGVTWYPSGPGGSSTTLNSVAAGDAGVMITTSRLGEYWVRSDGVWSWRGASAQPFLGYMDQVVWNGQEYLVVDGGNAAAYRSTDLETWEVQPWSNSLHVEGIAEFNGELIGITSSGTIARRGNDGEWIHQALALGEDLYSITNIQGTWMVFGDSMYESADGRNWNASTPFGGYRIREMVYTEAAGYIGLGTDGSIWIRREGENWTRHALPTGVTSTSDILAANSDFIVAASGRLYWSESAQSDTWSLGFGDTGLSFLRGVAWNGGSAFLAYGTNGVLLSSADGRSWSQITSPTTEHIEGAAYAHGRFIIGCANGSIWSSGDLSNWTEEESRCNQGMNQMVSFGDTVYAVGNWGLVLRSVNPGSWEHMTRTIVHGKELFDVAYSNGRYMAVGEVGAIHTSTDGETLQRMRAPDSATDLVAVAANTTGDRWVTVGYGSLYAWPETDGLWGQVATLDRPSAPGTAVSMQDVAFANGRFVAVGFEGVTAWSDDAQTWQTVHAVGAPNFMGVCAWPDGFAAITLNGSIYLSEDGTSWTYADRPSTTSGHGIEWNGSDLLAVCSGAAYLSENGTDWVAAAIPPWGSSPGGVSVVGDWFYVAFSTEMYRSMDGQNWETTYTAGVGTHAVAGTVEHMVAVGQYGGLRTADVVTIVSHPESQVVNGLTSVSLSVTATGPDPLDYQWYEGLSGDTSQPLADANASTLMLETVSESTSFWVRVTGGRAKADSDTATIEVIPPPVIETEPGDGMVPVLSGSTVTLTVSASGAEPLSYQWYQGAAGDTTNPVGADSAEYTTEPITVSTAFWVRVSNAGGSVDSRTATITVLDPPLIVSEPKDIAVTYGEFAVLDVVAVGTEPLMFQWYEGTTGDESLPIPGATGPLFVAGVLDATTTYWVEVSNPAGSAQSASATITVNHPPAIASGPADQTLLVGESVTLQVSATGTDPITYQWYQGNSGDTSQPVEGAASATWTSPVFSEPGTYRYWVRVSNVAGAENSTDATVTVQAPPQVVTHPQDTMIARGASATLSVTASGTAPLSYQWFEGSSGDTSNPIDTATSATLTTGNLNADTAFWVRVTNVAGSADSFAAGVVVLDPPTITNHPQSVTITEGSEVQLDVTAEGSAPLTYQWFVGTAGDELNPLPDSNLAAIAVHPANDRSYWVKVTNPVGSADSSAAQVTVLHYPTAVLSGDSSHVLEGESVTLTVDAAGTGPLRYEWYLGESGNTSTRIASASGNTYTTFPIPHDVSFWVRVINDIGYADSATFTVSTEMPVTILEHTTSSVVEFGAPAELSVLAEGAAPLSYQWYAGEAGDTSNPVAGGTGSSLSVEGLEDVAAFWVRVSNDASHADSGTIRVRPYQAHQSWGWSAPQPVGSPLRDAAWFNGRYYAVGTFGSILSSSDTVDWVPEFSGTDQTINSIAASTDRMVAVGENATAFVSTDGVLWIPVNAPLTGDFLDCIWDGSRFLATTNAGRVLISPDGFDWTAHALTGLSGEYELRAIAGNGTGYVLVGGRPDGYLSDGIVFTSTDGATWQENTALEFNELFDVVWTGERYIACGDYGSIYTSPNGQAWTAQTTPDDPRLHALVIGDDETLAMGLGGNIWRSTDGGESWSVIPTGEPQTKVGGTWGAHGLVVVCDRNPYDYNELRGGILTSTNGIDWAQQQAGFTDDLEGVCVGPQGFRAVGVGGVVYESTDGHNWTHQTTIPSTSWNGILHTGSEYVAYGSWGKIARSGDGTTWTVETPGPAVSYNGACLADGVLYLIGGKSIVRRGDGGSWETIDPGAPRYLSDIAWANDRFVAVGMTGLLMVSEDGTNWSEIDTGVNNSLTAVEWGEPGFVAIGTKESSYSTSILYSPDGVSWYVGDDAPFDAYTITFKNSLVWDGSHFVVVCARGYVATSETGSDWRIHRTPTDRSLKDLVAQGRYLYVVGENGTIVSSRIFFFTRQPQDQSVETDQSALLQVIAVAGGTAEYQWFEGLSGDTSRPVPGANASSLLTGPLQVSSNYWVRVRREDEFIDSQTAVVTVDSAYAIPQIVAAPSNLSVTEGDNAVFEAQWSGSSPQAMTWQRRFWNGGNWEWSDYANATFPEDTGNIATLLLTEVPMELNESVWRFAMSLNLGGQSIDLVSREASLVVQEAVDPFVVWLDEQGIENSNPAARAVEDLDGDGHPLFLEFALYGDPSSADAALVSMTKHQLDGAQFLRLTFLMRESAASLQWNIETSSDLNAWQPHALWMNGEQWLCDDPLDLVQFSVMPGIRQFTVDIPMPENGEPLIARVSVE